MHQTHTRISAAGVQTVITNGLLRGTKKNPRVLARARALQEGLSPSSSHVGNLDSFPAIWQDHSKRHELVHLLPPEKEGLAPPRCPFEAGTIVVQIISAKQIFALWK